jgi:putative thioredoxin
MLAPRPNCARLCCATRQDRQARFDLALALHAAGKVDEAVDELLDLFRLDREWNDGAPRRS